MRDYITIGSTPAEEDCAQVGTDDYYCRMRIEQRAFRRQLLRQFGEPPGNARIRTKSFPHDHGEYHEVVVTFDDQSEEEVEYAMKVEAETPMNWDAEALKEVQDGLANREREESSRMDNL